ncbi:hypothetical protein NCAS_0H02100 [Naumovozyma castellii]|uniref:Ubiquitin carboxyl-terminal hydrolase 2 n=1 Tax=Naumovozyma castellii TaxID=27288 RepID=G0VJ41_NAUCA|nr:hypothetical protein NCAS_0H02100 [Naumovozyma castellii CBS 4309]CCC71520.1 hypothetical protein NCAS_0H02100 [Naumovozyma castellii CBS 4309]
MLQDNEQVSSTTENASPMLDVSERKDTQRIEVRVADDGKQLLYPNVENHFPMKTAERLIDDIIADLSFLTGIAVDNGSRGDIDTMLGNGILKQSMLNYSKVKNQPGSFEMGSLIDQVTLQTKYEYKSVTCPELNKLQVFFGVLFNNSTQITNLDEVTQFPIYHLKVTVKTRNHLELTKKHAGVTQFHLVDQLHVYDKQDIPTFNPEDPNLLDYAIYVSNDTNKLILIEVFKPEFQSADEIESFKSENINERYQKACEQFDTLNPNEPPTQLDCLNTLFKVFKGPLSRKSSDEPSKTIDSTNKTLNSHINPEWLTSKYGFNIVVDEDLPNAQQSVEYEPPELVNYVEDFEVRRLRETYIRRCLQLIFWGKLSINLRINDPTLKNSKSYKSINALQTNFTITPLLQLFKGSGQNFLMGPESRSPLDFNFHFINLSACYHYTDRDVIRNYERLCHLDPQNVGVYFDALNYIANTKGSYQLIAYCGKQDIVGQEALDQALKSFNLDPMEVDITKINDSVLLTLYKNELKISTSDIPNLKNAMRLFAKVKHSSKLKFYIDHEPYRRVAQAYETLDIDESVDDDIVQTAYDIKVVDSPGLTMDCDRALYTIAIHKRSLLLFTFLIERCPDFQEYYCPDRFTYHDALSMFQVNENAADELIIKNFQARWFNESVFEPESFVICVHALVEIGLQRNSSLISNFLQTGKIDPNCLPIKDWPAGINNIGNTCYLNSLLQYYFSIAPLRNYVLQYSKTIEDFKTLENNASTVRRIGGREVSNNEVERSIQFIYQLRDLFHAMVYSNERCVTPRRELAYLAFAPSNIEVEFETNENQPATQQDNPEVTTAELGQDKDEKERSVDSGDISMSDNITPKDAEEEEDQVAESNKNQDVSAIVSSPTKDIIMTDNTDTVVSNEGTSTKVAKISSDQLENALEMGRQQDVTECIGNVLFQLESGSEPLDLHENDNEQDDLVKQLFYGELEQTIVPLANPDQRRPKLERFLSLLVNIGDHPRDIYDALDLYFKDEYLKMEEYGDVKRTVAVTKFPTILQIQIQRVYYDREKFMPFKSIEPLPFEEKIYMDRYSVTDNPELIARKNETLLMKEKLVELKKKQRDLLSRNSVGLSKKDSYIELGKLLSSDSLESQGIILPEKDEMVSSLKTLTAGIDDELNQLYAEISQLEETINGQFNEFKGIGYSIFAVFIHRGEASYGHYWIYIKDRSQNGIWRKYNDETVSEVPEEEVYNFTEGNTATPYFLVYVKEGEEQEIEPLKRIIETNQE